MAKTCDQDYDFSVSVHDVTFYEQMVTGFVAGRLNSDIADIIPKMYIGKEYGIKWDDKDYNLICKADSTGKLYIGNIHLNSPTGTNTKEPFLFTEINDGIWISNQPDKKEHKLQVMEIRKECEKLPDPPKPEQSKTVEITANGDYPVTPDVGKVLSQVIAKVNVPTGGGGGASPFARMELKHWTPAKDTLSYALSDEEVKDLVFLYISGKTNGEQVVFCNFVEEKYGLWYNDPKFGLSGWMLCAESITDLFHVRGGQGFLNATYNQFGDANPQGNGTMFLAGTDYVILLGYGPLTE